MCRFLYNFTVDIRDVLEIISPGLLKTRPRAVINSIMVTEYNFSFNKAFHIEWSAYALQAANRNVINCRTLSTARARHPKNECSNPERCIAHSIQTADTVQYSNYDTNNIERAKAKIFKKRKRESIKDKKSGCSSGIAIRHSICRDAHMHNLHRVHASASGY
jgi:hypothetical protein